MAQVQVEKTITTYQKNKFGDADDNYLNIERMFLLMFITRFLRAQITSKFSRMKLANDSTRFAPGAAIVTPNVIRTELIASIARWNITDMCRMQRHLQKYCGWSATAAIPSVLMCFGRLH